jgi:hypothetical protein
MHKKDNKEVSSVEREVTDVPLILLCMNYAAVQRPGLPDFSWYNVPKRGKIYHVATKYPKCP